MQRKEVSIPMVDSCKLTGTLFLPGEGKFPLILEMTPYGRYQMESLATHYVQAGYAFLSVDVRGRFASEGVFQPITQERGDMPAVAAWLNKQRWFDNNKGIGIFGFGYGAAPGLLLAKECHLVKTIVNIGGIVDMYDLAHRNGVLNLHSILPWTIITGWTKKQPSLKSIDWQRVYSSQPLSKAAQTADFPNTFWDAMVRHNTRDCFWDELSIRNELPDIRIPILHYAGWFDMCLGATMDLYNSFSSSDQMPRQQLVLGPTSGFKAKAPFRPAM